MGQRHRCRDGAMGHERPHLHRPSINHCWTRRLGCFSLARLLARLAVTTRPLLGPVTSGDRLPGRHLTWAHARQCVGQLDQAFPADPVGVAGQNTARQAVPQQHEARGSGYWRAWALTEPVRIVDGSRYGSVSPSRFRRAGRSVVVGADIDVGSDGRRTLAVSRQRGSTVICPHDLGWSAAPPCVALAFRSWMRGRCDAQRVVRVVETTTAVGSVGHAGIVRRRATTSL